MLKKYDILIFSIIVASGLLGLLAINLVFNKGSNATVYLNNEVIEVLPLNKNTKKVYKTKDGYNTVVVKNGYVYVQKANCKNQICVNTKKQNRKRKTITCIPHKFMVEVN